MATAFTGNIADVIDKELHKFEKELLKYYNTLWKKALTTSNPQFSFIRLLDKESKTSTLQEVILSNTNKKILNIIDDTLMAITDSTGVEIGNVVFYRDIKTLNNVYIGDLDNTIKTSVKQNIGSYMFEDDMKKVIKSISGVIGKSIARTNQLMREALITYARKVADIAYNKVEASLAKAQQVVVYIYQGVRDNKNSEFCAEHIGQKHTREEWLKIKSDIFINGGHFGCRHSLEISKVVKAPKKEG